MNTTASVPNTGKADSNTLKSGITAEQLLTLAMDMGEKMIICGGEANRVEDMITRICMAYGCVRVDVFSITSYISASILTSDGHRQTQARRIYSYSNNLNKLERLNAISRFICETTPAYEELPSKIADIKPDTSYPWYLKIIGYMLASGAFAIFFGGSVKDGMVSALIAIIAYFVDLKLKPFRINAIIYNFICTFFCGILAHVFSFSGLVDDLNKVFIGLVMLYIPGVQMTNSIRDILCGDIMSGLLRLIEAIILAVSIAIGFASSVILLHYI